MKARNLQLKKRRVRKGEKKHEAANERKKLLKKMDEPLNGQDVRDIELLVITLKGCGPCCFVGMN